MSSPTRVHANSAAEPIPVVFGQDGTGKPRPLWFDAASADLATTAADPMKMRVLKIKAGEHKALAHHLTR
jgi:hypothetical protein